MTIEEKAKAYDEALERAKNLHKDAIDMEENLLAKQCEIIFPELEESEDEKIRKALVRFHKSTIDIDGIKGADILAWLEKQCDTNETINRNEFTQGVLKGAAINLITWIDYNAAEGNMCLSNMECKDIEDALVNGDWDKIYAYIKKKLEKQGEQKPSNVDYYHVDDEVGNPNDWVITTSHDKVKPIFNIGDVLCDKSCTTLNKNSQPNIEILDIRNGMYICNNCTFPISQQDEYELVTKKIEPQSAWSDEDDYNLQCMIAKVTCDIQQGYIGRNNELIDWLKSIKQRYTWKPSKEQMKTLEYYMHTLLATEHKEVLFGLYNDLKKL